MLFNRKVKSTSFADLHNALKALSVSKNQDSEQKTLNYSSNSESKSSDSISKLIASFQRFEPEDGHQRRTLDELVDKQKYFAPEMDSVPNGSCGQMSPSMFLQPVGHYLWNPNDQLVLIFENQYPCEAQRIIDFINQHYSIPKLLIFTTGVPQHILRVRKYLYQINQAENLDPKEKFNLINRVIIMTLMCIIEDDPNIKQLLLQNLTNFVHDSLKTTSNSKDAIQKPAKVFKDSQKDLMRTTKTLRELLEEVKWMQRQIVKITFLDGHPFEKNELLFQYFILKCFSSMLNGSLVFDAIVWRTIAILLWMKVLLEEIDECGMPPMPESESSSKSVRSGTDL